MALHVELSPAKTLGEVQAVLRTTEHVPSLKQHAPGAGGTQTKRSEVPEGAVAVLQENWVAGPVLPACAPIVALTPELGIVPRTMSKSF